MGAQGAIKGAETDKGAVEAEVVDPEPSDEAQGTDKPESGGGDLKALLDERRRKLFGYMKDKHGYATSEKIRDRILLVLGEDNKFSSVNDFILDDKAYYMFFEKDASTPKDGEDPGGELYGTDPEDDFNPSDAQKKGDFKLS